MKKIILSTLILFIVNNINAAYYRIEKLRYNGSTSGYDKVVAGEWHKESTVTGADAVWEMHMDCLDPGVNCCTYSGSYPASIRQNINPVTLGNYMNTFIAVVEAIDDGNANNPINYNQIVSLPLLDGTFQLFIYKAVSTASGSIIYTVDDYVI